jgi:hypothetical protein
MDADIELPDRTTWRASAPLTIGIEEEFMLLIPATGRWPSGRTT